MTRFFGTPNLWPVSQRGQLNHLVPSKPSRNPSPISTLNIRFILVFCLRYFSDDYVSRIRLPSRTRSKYCAHASLCLRSFSRSLRVMRRRKNFVKDYQRMQVIPVQTGCLNPPSKLEDVEEQLQSLRGESALLRFVDNAQAGEDVNRILEDIQEAVNDYMVRL